MHHRRDFLKASLAGAAWALAPRLSAFDTPATTLLAPRTAIDRVALGRTGIRSSFLAQGTGFHGWGGSSDQTRLGQADFTRLVRHGLDEGLNFLDMADQYGSHTYMREALRGVPRDKVVLLTKLYPTERVRPAGGTRAEVDRFRRELGSDHLDICLLHCVTTSRWPTEFARVLDELQALKEQGALRAVGISCHDFGALELAATHPWVDVLFARVNHRGGPEYSCDAAPQEIARVLKLARANGKAVVGMKIFGAGKLTRPEDKDASLRFVLKGGLVDAMTIGMLSAQQVDDTSARIRAAFAA
jgi:1-deoxyxylulose-5-phosphate synthase